MLHRTKLEVALHFKHYLQQQKWTSKFQTLLTKNVVNRGYYILFTFLTCYVGEMISEHSKVQQRDDAKQHVSDTKIRKYR